MERCWALLPLVRLCPKPAERLHRPTMIGYVPLIPAPPPPLYGTTMRVSREPRRAEHKPTWILTTDLWRPRPQADNQYQGPKSMGSVQSLDSASTVEPRQGATQNKQRPR